MSAASATSYDGAILGIGNPLLDISASVPQSFLDKYSVKVNNAILAEEKHLPLYDDLVKNYPVEYIAGGATQNSIRVAQWMLQKPGSTTYLGCVGNDKFGSELRKSASGDGVNVLYDVDEKQPTGTCAVLINDKDRSLIANLAAANHFKQSHLSVPDVAAALSKAQIVYSAGFFLTVSPPSLLQIAASLLASKRTFAVNLAAPFIPSFFSEPLASVIEYADYVFGNESEAEAWATKQGVDSTDVSKIALAIAALPKKDASRPRIVVITQGSKSTLVATNGSVQSYDVPKIDKEKIVDCNGAGDAFVGGFLSQLVQSAPIAKCVDAGHYAAGCIIQVSGTKLTGKPSFQ